MGASGSIPCHSFCCAHSGLPDLWGPKTQASVGPSGLGRAWAISDGPLGRNDWPRTSAILLRTRIYSSVALRQSQLNMVLCDLVEMGSGHCKFLKCKYWNGAVWNPHNFMLWKALKEQGRDRDATGYLEKLGEEQIVVAMLVQAIKKKGLETVRAELNRGLETKELT